MRGLALFYDPDEFDFVSEVRSRWETLRAEVLALHRNLSPIDRTGGRSHEELAVLLEREENVGWVSSWQAGSEAVNHDWLVYGIVQRGFTPPATRRLLPGTVELFSKLGCVDTAAFSLLKGRSRIYPHRHPELGGDRLTFHLGLVVEPGRAVLHVGGEFREEGENRPLVFDGSKEHFAFNLSDRERIILYVEFDRSRAGAAVSRQSPAPAAASPSGVGLDVGSRASWLDALSLPAGSGLVVLLDRTAVSKIFAKALNELAGIEGAPALRGVIAASETELAAYREERRVRFPLSRLDAASFHAIGASPPTCFLLRDGAVVEHSPGALPRSVVRLLKARRAEESE